MSAALQEGLIVRPPLSQTFYCRAHADDPGYLFTNDPSQLTRIHEREISAIDLEVPLHPCFNELADAERDVQIEYIRQMRAMGVTTYTPRGLKIPQGHELTELLVESRQHLIRMQDLFFSLEYVDPDFTPVTNDGINKPSEEVRRLHLDIDANYVMTSALLNKGTILLLGAVAQHELSDIVRNGIAPEGRKLSDPVETGHVLLMKQGSFHLSEQRAHKAWYEEGAMRAGFALSTPRGYD